MTVTEVIQEVIVLYFLIFSSNYYFLGFVSTAKARRIKSGGSIRMHGTCPSRIVANISVNGNYFLIILILENVYYFL